MGPDVRWVGNREWAWTYNGIGVLFQEKTSTKMPIAANSQKEVLAQPTGDMMGQDLGSRAVIAKAKSLVWYPAEIDVSIRPGCFTTKQKTIRLKQQKS